MKKTKNLLIILIAGFAFVNIIGGIWIVNTIKQNVTQYKQITEKGSWTTPIYQYEVKEEKGLTKQWEKKNVFSHLEWLSSGMVAQDNRLFLFGALNSSDPQSLVILDSSDGGQVWRSDPIDIGSDFVVTHDSLYLAKNSSGTVSKISLSNYQHVWDIKLNSSHGPCCLQVVGEQIQGYWEPYYFYILSAADGSIQKRLAKEGSPMFRLDQNIKYYRAGTSALSADTVEGSEIWDVHLDKEFWQAPIFDQQMVFVRSGSSRGKVYAIHRFSGEILWISEDNVISTLALSKERLFYFTNTGAFLGVNKNSGKIEISMQLCHDDRIPSNLDGENNYKVAYDPSRHFIYLLLGDSDQLFAFQEDDANR